jgi:ankyrin repeat protein
MEYNALHIACHYGNDKIVKSLLENDDIDIDFNIDNYSPKEFVEVKDDGTFMTNYFKDCRGMVLTEVENRKKREVFDNMIYHFIEYPPFIEDIYEQCFYETNTSTINTIISMPVIGWKNAEKVLNSYYLNNTTFYLEKHIANVFDKTSADTITFLSHKERKNKTLILMRILRNSFIEMLKPDQKDIKRHYIRPKYII